MSDPTSTEHEERDERLAAILDHLEGLLEDARTLLGQKPPAPEPCEARFGWFDQIVDGTAARCALPKGHVGSHLYPSSNPAAEVPSEPLGPGEHRPATVQGDLRKALLVKACEQGWVEGDTDGMRYATSTAMVVIDEIVGAIDKLAGEAYEHTSEQDGRDGFRAALDLLKADLEERPVVSVKRPLKDMEPPPKKNPPGIWPMSSQWGPS